MKMQCSFCTNHSTNNEFVAVAIAPFHGTKIAALFIRKAFAYARTNNNCLGQPVPGERAYYTNFMGARRKA
jgi:hypothetical protein